jgi:hypothetical protein
MAEELQEVDTKIEEDRKKYGYEITQKLTYFIITVELALCGYMLLNAEKLKAIQEGSYLFLTCGIAAFTGILWRFCYNITYHAHAHYKGDLHPSNRYFATKTYRTARYLQGKLHNIYALLTLSSFLWILIAGFIYLSNIPA